MREQIARAIRAALPNFLEEHGLEDPYDINCGLCEEFAIEIIDQLGGETETLCMVWIEDVVDTPFPDASHAVICLVVDETYIYFDCECPEGTTDLRQIPAMKNQGKSRGDVLAERGTFCCG